MTRDARTSLARFVGSTRVANKRLEDSRSWYEQKVRKPFAAGK